MSGRVVPILATVLTLAPLSLVHAQGAPGAAASQDPVPPSRVRVHFGSQLFDATLALAHRHAGPERAAPEAFLTEAEVQVWVAGERVEVAARTDLEGRVDIDLGELAADASIYLTARSGDVSYLSVDFRASEPPPAKTPMYRCSTEGRGVLQQMTRVVTENENAVTGERKIHIRQIMTIVNRGFEVHLPQDGALGIFPVPAGARVTSLTVRGEPQVALKPKQHEAWNAYGVGLKATRCLYPNDPPIQVMGTYILDTPEGDVVDLGFPAVFATVEYTLALEQRKFEYLGDGDAGTPLVQTGAMPAPGVQKTTDGWRRQDIPAGQTVVARVRFGDPGIALSVWLVTLAWVVGILGPLGLGLWIARGQRRRTPETPVDEYRHLDERFARGEIDFAAYERAQEELRHALQDRLPAAAPTDDLLELLDAIAAREYRGVEQVGEDLRTLARLLREHVGARKT